MRNNEESGQEVRVGKRTDRFGGVWRNSVAQRGQAVPVEASGLLSTCPAIGSCHLLARGGGVCCLWSQGHTRSGASRTSLCQTLGAHIPVALPSRIQGLARQLSKPCWVQSGAGLPGAQHSPEGGLEEDAGPGR